MVGTLIELHPILADLITTIGFLYLFARWILSKIRLSSVSYRLDTGLLIEIYMEPPKTTKLLKLLNFKQQGGSLCISKI